MSSTNYYPGLPSTYTPRIHTAEVIEVRKLGPGMIRVVFGGQDMLDYPTTGVGDEFVRLFFPDAPDDAVRLPFVTERGWDYPAGVEPSHMRTYTIRNHRAAEIDIDFVEHDGGVAAAWAAQTRPGRYVGINPPKALYARPDWARKQILVADEPALPAALRIAEMTSNEVETVLLAEVRGPDYQLTAACDNVSYTWLRGTGNGYSPSELLPALQRLPIDVSTYVWVAGETRFTRTARSYLRHEREHAPDGQKSIGYWTDNAEAWRERYDALGEDFQAKVRALYESDRDTEEIVDEVFRLYDAAGL